MGVHARKQGDVCILDVSGVSRLGEDSALRDEVSSLVLAGERKLVLDLSQVPFVDSLAMTEVLACYKRARAAGADTKLVLNRRAREVFALTRLHLVFDIHEDVERAVKAF